MGDKKHPLEVWIERSEYSVSQLAELLGVSRQTIYNWTAGTCYPTVGHLMELHNLSRGAITLADFASVQKYAAG
jgi:predicted transcriptional regulator